MGTNRLFSLTKLVGQANYEIWALRMGSVFVEKGLWEYMLPTDSMPSILAADQASAYQTGTSKALA